MTDDLPATRQHTIGDLEIMAKAVATSRLFPGVETPQAALTLMLLCESENLHPMQAMRRFHIIEGRPTMRADAMQAEFQRRGGSLRWIKSDDKECQAEFAHPSAHPEPVTIRVTLNELIESGVATQWDRDKKRYDLKGVYKKFPAQMLRARVISQGVRMVLPGVVAGIYTPEEVGDFDDRPPRPKSIETTEADAVATPEPAEHPHEPARDPRSFAKLVDDKANAVNKDWKDEQPGAHDLIAQSAIFHHLLEVGIAKSHIIDPGAILPPAARNLLSTLYVEVVEGKRPHYLWLRKELVQYLERKKLEAYQAAALEAQGDDFQDDFPDEDQVGALEATATDYDGALVAVVPRMREPGEEG